MTFEQFKEERFEAIYSFEPAPLELLRSAFEEGKSEQDKILMKRVEDLARASRTLLMFFQTDDIYLSECEGKMIDKAKHVIQDGESYK